MKNRNILILGVMYFLTIVPMSYAHEKRAVAGQFEFIVGFAEEPAFSQQTNGVDLRIARNGQPVEGLEKTLKVTISRDEESRSMELSLKPKYKEPGRYTAYFLPTKPGKYIFLIQGTINGVSIHEKFESGQGFHDVEDTNLLRFP